MSAEPPYSSNTLTVPRQPVALSGLYVKIKRPCLAGSVSSVSSIDTQRTTNPSGIGDRSMLTGAA